MELEGPEFVRMVREEYVYAIEMARALHDPTEDWDGFCDTLWTYLLRVFGMPLEHGGPWGVDDLRGSRRAPSESRHGTDERRHDH